MNTMQPMPERATFDFQNNKVEIMDLSTLRRTHREDGASGLPMRDIYHFDAIGRAMAICDRYNLNYTLEEIFAAHNHSKHQPGVSVLKGQEEIYGEKAIEAHILRRVYTTIYIHNHETDELATSLVLACHQDGLQAAIGPCVKICHNQCIMFPERTVATYGKTRVGLDDFFATIDGWLSEFDVQMTADRERINRLKQTKVSEQDIFTYIGLLNVLRVSHDSSDKRLCSRVATYPLNQTQINSFTEDILKRMLERGEMTAWDIYNVATEYYKPDRAEIPTLVPQNLAFATTLYDFLDLQEAEYEILE